MQFPPLRTSSRLAAKLTLALLPLLLTGCDVDFWTMSGHQTTMVTEGPVARDQLKIFYVTCWVTGIIFLLVGAVLAYATVKFRARTEADEHAEPPPQGHGNPLIELTLIALSVAALVVIAIPTLRGIWYSYDVPEAERANTYEITATGEQWWFRFTYPTEQIAGAGVLTTANELVIPVGRPVRIALRTADVIHSFWVPKLAGKVDMMPNRGNFLWLQADQPGYYWGQCAEYCGDSHAVMRFRVIALEQNEFNAWLAAQKAPARNVAGAPALPPLGDAAGVAALRSTLAAQPRPQFATFRTNEYGFSPKWDAGAAESPLALWKAQQQPSANESPVLIGAGRQLFRDKFCISCHVVAGHDGASTMGPNLTHVGSRTTIAAGLLENSPDQLARWLMNPNIVKPGNKMFVGYGQFNITISPEEAAALVAYLHSLK